MPMRKSARACAAELTSASTSSAARPADEGLGSAQPRRGIGIDHETALVTYFGRERIEATGPLLLEEYL